MVCVGAVVVGVLFGGGGGGGGAPSWSWHARPYRPKTPRTLHVCVSVCVVSPCGLVLAVPCVGAWIPQSPRRRTSPCRCVWRRPTCLTWAWRCFTPQRSPAKNSSVCWCPRAASWRLTSCGRRPRRRCVLLPRPPPRPGARMPRACVRHACPPTPRVLSTCGHECLAVHKTPLHARHQCWLCALMLPPARGFGYPVSVAHAVAPRLVHFDGGRHPQPHWRTSHPARLLVDVVCVVVPWLALRQGDKSPEDFRFERAILLLQVWWPPSRGPCCGVATPPPPMRFLCGACVCA